VEITGSESDSLFLFVFPSDLAFPHEIMHDLVDLLSLPAGTKGRVFLFMAILLLFSGLNKG